MRDMLVPAAMLSATLGLALGLASKRSIGGVCAAIMLAAALSAGLTSLRPLQPDRLVTLILIEIMMVSIAVFVPRLFGFTILCAASIVVGVTVGLAVSTAQPSGFEYAVALPVLLFIPAWWAVRRGFAVAARIVMSWILAATLLAAVLPHIVAHPGYVPDHRE